METEMRMLHWDDIDILDFYGEDSLLIRHFEDTGGKIIGFIGFAGREEETYLTEEELQIIHLLLGSFSKEIAVREYKGKGSEGQQYIRQYHE